MITKTIGRWLARVFSILRLLTILTIFEIKEKDNSLIIESSFDLTLIRKNYTFTYNYWLFWVIDLLIWLKNTSTLTLSFETFWSLWSLYEYIVIKSLCSHVFWFDSIDNIIKYSNRFFFSTSLSYLIIILAWRNKWKNKTYSEKVNYFETIHYYRIDIYGITSWSFYWAKSWGR